MRHRKAGRQFSRNTSHRRAMLRALTSNLVAHERIETTDAKAKELRRVAERMITRAIRLGSVAYTPQAKLSIADSARRQAAQRQMGRFLRRFAVVSNTEGSQKVDLVEKVFVDLAQRFKSRPGGYTRIIKVGRRRGDNAPMSVIEFVDRPAKSEASGVAKGKAAQPAVEAKTADAPAAKAKTKATAKPKSEEAPADVQQPATDKAAGKAESKTTKPADEAGGSAATPTKKRSAAKKSAQSPAASGKKKASKSDE